MPFTCRWRATLGLRCLSKHLMENYLGFDTEIHSFESLFMAVYSGIFSEVIPIALLEVMLY